MSKGKCENFYLFFILMDTDDGKNQDLEVGMIPV